MAFFKNLMPQGKSWKDVLTSKYVLVPAGVVATIAVAKVLLWRRANPNNLQGKRVVITGASSGIGADTALLYTRCGASVVLAARRMPELEQVAEQCRQTATGGAKAIPIQCDVTKPDDCKKLIEQSIQQLGGIDILVLNAGIGQVCRVQDLPNFDEARRVYEINFWGGVYPTHYAIPELERTHGSIVAVSSLWGLISGPMRAMYCSSKRAMHAFFESVRCETQNVSVTMVCPGPVATPIHTNTPDMLPSADAARYLVEAELNKCREFVFPGGRRIGPLRFFLPGRWIDRIITRITYAHEDRVAAMEGRRPAYLGPA